MLGIIFFTHMGLLRSPGTICQNAQRFVGSDKVIPTFGGDRVISQSMCMGSRSGCRVHQGHETSSFTHVYDGDSDQLMIRCCQLTRDIVMVARGVLP